MKPVQFRLSDETLKRLDWLARHLDLNRSQVVRLAIAEMYDRRHVARLVEAEGQWALVMDDRPIAWGDAALLSSVAPQLLEQMRAGLPDREALGELLLALLKAGGQPGEGFHLAENYIREAVKAEGSPRPSPFWRPIAGLPGQAACGPRRSGSSRCREYHSGLAERLCNQWPNRGNRPEMTSFSHLTK